MAEDSSPPMTKHDGDVGDAVSSSDSSDPQKLAGVEGIEAISLSWTKAGLITAYLGYVRADLIRFPKASRCSYCATLPPREQSILDGNSQLKWTIAPPY